jgi:K+-transporting ATPase ATPase C chain
MVVFTVLLGVAYPLVITGLGQLLFPDQANGTLLRDQDGTVVGSSLLGQAFLDTDGRPLAQYFQPRPSAAGYDAGASSASNHGPEHPQLIADIIQRRAEVAAFNNVAPEAVPADALTASGSGLEPDISPAYAAIQVDRVAQARGLPADQVRDLVAQYTVGRDLGFLGEPRVNVVELNLALDELPQ